MNWLTENVSGSWWDNRVRIRQGCIWEHYEKRDKHSGPVMYCVRQAGLRTQNTDSQIRLNLILSFNTGNQMYIKQNKKGIGKLNKQAGRTQPPPDCSFSLFEGDRDAGQRETQTLNTRGNQGKEETSGKHSWQKSNRRDRWMQNWKWRTPDRRSLLKVKHEVRGMHTPRRRLMELKELEILNKLKSVNKLN